MYGPVLLILYPDDHPRRIPFVCQRVHIPQLEKVIPCMAHGFPELGALGDLLPPVRAVVEMFWRVKARLAGDMRMDKRSGTRRSSTRPMPLPLAEQQWMGLIPLAYLSLDFFSRAFKTD